MSPSAPDPLAACDDLPICGTADITRFSLARGVALSMGILALQIATRPQDADPVPELEEFRQLGASFATRIDGVLPALEHERLKREVEADLAAIRDFRRAASGFDGPDGFTRDRAIALATAARREVLPSVSRIMARMQQAETDRQAARDAQTAARAAMLDSLLREMKRIGRMIGMISINASVEAARAGGDSGRSFKAIAEEVRTLAQRSSDLVDRMQQRMADDAAAETPRAARSGA